MANLHVMTAVYLIVRAIATGNFTEFPYGVHG
jgi:hypothetical protein